jgi:predicted GH43/DUF377 family glycosyl hydrolase
MEIEGGRYAGDKEGILELDAMEGQIAVCNPSVCPNYVEGKGWPILVRSRMRADNNYGEASVLNLGYLATPTSVVNYKTLIEPFNNDSKFGIEDGRVTKNGDVYQIVSVGWDGENARLLHHTTDLNNIEYNGVISAPFTYAEAIDIAGKDSYYGRIWSKFDPNRIVQDKDAALYFFQDGGVGLIHRWDPAMQLSVASSISDFKNRDYWAEELRNAENRTILDVTDKELKIGLGGPPVPILDKDGNLRHIGTYHSVKKIEKEDCLTYCYSGSFFEFDPTTKTIISRLIDPLFIPRDDDILQETHENRMIIKEVAFPTAKIQDRENPEVLCVYLGKGDKKIGYRAISRDWLMRELSNPHNQLGLERVIAEAA